MTPEQLEAIAAQLYVEMLEAGFAAVAEFHYLHHAPDGSPYADRAEMSARIAAAAGATGIGLTLLPVLLRPRGFGGAPPAPGQRRFVNDLDGFARLLRGLPRGLRRLDAPRLRAAFAARRRRRSELPTRSPALAGDGPIHIHVAEQSRRWMIASPGRGARPVDGCSTTRRSTSAGARSTRPT